MSPAEEAAALMAQGYCRVSNKYRILARIDRPDFLQVMAESLRRAPADFYVPLTNEVQGSWCDYYRRILSKDKITVSAEVSRLVCSSNWEPLAFRPKPGEVP